MGMFIPPAKASSSSASDRTAQPIDLSTELPLPGLPLLREGRDDVRTRVHNIERIIASCGQAPVRLSWRHRRAVSSGNHTHKRSFGLRESGRTIGECRVNSRSAVSPKLCRFSHQIPFSLVAACRPYRDARYHPVQVEWLNSVNFPPYHIFYRLTGDMRTERAAPPLVSPSSR